MRAQDQEPASTSRSQPRRAPTRDADPAPIPLHPAAPMTPEVILHLQRTIGNAAVARRIEAQQPRSRADGGEHEPVQRSTVHDVLRSPGRPLDDDTRTEMEGRLSADFGDVRMHTDTTAQRSAEAIGARAYTSGNHVVLGAGGGDAHTLAHELTHVVQQRSGPVSGTDVGGLKVSDPADRFEREAEETAHRVMSGPVPETPVARSAEAPATGEHSRTPMMAPAQDGAVQRAVSKTSDPFFQRWAGDPRLTPQQKNWVLKKLAELTGHPVRLKKLTHDEALGLLAENNVTRETMDAEIGPSASTAQHREPPESMEQFEKQAMDTVENADRTWRKFDPQMPKVETATFEITGLGRGTVAMLKSAAPNHSNMLAWFSHGFEDQNPITVGTSRKYGFAVQEEQGLERIGATAEVFASLPQAFENADIEETTEAPGEYVLPHQVTELSVELDRVIGLVNHCDVAVLLDFVWSDNVANEYAAARTAETPPLPVIIEEAESLKKYKKLLIYACRTPWGVNAATEGSSRLKATLKKELMDQEGISEPDASNKAYEKYTGSPRKGQVYR